MSNLHKRAKEMIAYEERSHCHECGGNVGIIKELLKESKRQSALLTIGLWVMEQCRDNQSVEFIYPKIVEEFNKELDK